MKLINKSLDTLKRRVNGGWAVLKPGDTVDIPTDEAEYLLVAESGYWQKADVEPDKPKKGGA